MSPEVPIAQAKARFAETVRRAELGETIVLTRHGRPVARLTGAAASRGDQPSAEVREPAPAYGAVESSRTDPPTSTPESRREALERLLNESIWPGVPREQLGAAPSKGEREEILGYREGGA